MRPATPLDAGAIAAVHVSSWQEAYARLLPPEVLDAHAQGAPRRWAERLSNPDGPWYWLAERAGKAVGFSWAEAVGPCAIRPLELVGLYVLASEYGRGTADALLRTAIGDAPCFLWVPGVTHRRGRRRRGSRCWSACSGRW